MKIGASSKMNPESAKHSKSPLELATELSVLHLRTMATDSLPVAAFRSVSDELFISQADALEHVVSYAHLTRYPSEGWALATSVRNLRDWSSGRPAEMAPAP